MPDPTSIARQLQAAIFLAADTMHVWRDGAIVVLAVVVIVLVRLAAGER